jgi:putative transposase
MLLAPLCGHQAAFGRGNPLIALSDFSRPPLKAPQHLCFDKGYDYAEPRRLAEAFGFTLHLRTRGEEVAAKRHADAKARRWVVERTHSWFNRFRGILIRWSKKPANYLAMIHIACGVIAWRTVLSG